MNSIIDTIFCHSLRFGCEIPTPLDRLLNPSLVSLPSLHLLITSRATAMPHSLERVDEEETRRTQGSKARARAPDWTRPFHTKPTTFTTRSIIEAAFLSDLIYADLLLRTRRHWRTNPSIMKNQVLANTTALIECSKQVLSHTIACSADFSLLCFRYFEMYVAHWWSKVPKRRCKLRLLKEPAYTIEESERAARLRREQKRERTLTTMIQEDLVVGIEGSLSPTVLSVDLKITITL